MTAPIPPPTPKRQHSLSAAEPFEVQLHTLLPVLLGDETIPSPFDNADEYLGMLDGLDIKDADKRDLIHTLQILIETIVGIRFGVDPVTLELRDRSEKLASDSKAVIKSRKDGLEVEFSATSHRIDANNEGTNERI